MYGRVPRRCSDLARKRTIDDPISPWQRTYEQVLADSPVPTDELEIALDRLDTRLEKYEPGIDLDAFTHLCTDQGYEGFSEEQEKEYAKQIKRVRDGDFQGWGRSPQPAAKNAKLQVTVANSTWDLLNNWAAAEDRGLSEVANAAIQAGLRALRADGVIPQSAIDSYEAQCQRRLTDAHARRVVGDFLYSATQINF